jgi:glycosyltransferase involved in cell wall biosynthesis
MKVLFIISNNIAGAEKRFLNVFKNSSDHYLLLNSFLYELYIEVGLLGHEDNDLLEKVVVIKEWLLTSYLFRKLYRGRFKFLFTLINRVNLIVELYRRASFFRQVTLVHGLLEGTRYLSLLRKLYPTVHYYSSIVNPTLEFTQRKSWVNSYRVCSAVDCLNENIAREAVQIGVDPKLIAITPNTFTDYSRCYSVKKEKLVVFSGRLIRQKNPNIFIEAAIEYVNLYPEDGVAFRVLGDGPMYDQLKLRLDSQSSIVRNSVSLNGFVADPVQHLSRALVFVQLSDTESHATQSMLEAMGCECYIVVSEILGISKVVQPSFGSIVPLSSVSLSQIFKYVIDSFDRTVESGKSARAFAVEQFSIDSYLRYLDIALYSKFHTNSTPKKQSIFSIISYILFR